MNEQLISSKVQQLSSEHLKKELLFYLDYLLAKQNTDTQKNAKKTPKFGCAKGRFKMANDFDEPLDDFKDYMP